MGALKKIRETAIDAVAGEVPGAGFLRDKQKNHYRRKRAKETPSGWTAAEATVQNVESKDTNQRIGNQPGTIDYVWDTTITYAVDGPSGDPLSLVVGPAELLSQDVSEGGREGRGRLRPSQPI